MKISKRNYSILAAAAIVALLTFGYAAWNSFDSSPGEPKRGPKPTSTAESRFLLNEMYYSCSKELEGKWVEARVGQLDEPGYYFRPHNEQELQKFCRIDAAIEYRAVLDILRRDDVSKAISQYDTSQAWVRALGHKYIKDTAYLDRILPAYSHIKIDCIIVVHTPESTRFFIENGEKHDSHTDHQYQEVPASEFLASLTRAPEADVTAFWLGLH